MKNLLQQPELNSKHLAIGAFVAFGVCLSAFAQAPLPDLPPLPSPAVPAASGAPPQAGSTALPEINLPAMPVVSGNVMPTASPLPAMSAAPPKPEVAQVPSLPPIAAGAGAPAQASPSLPSLPPIGVQASSTPITPEVTVDAELPEFDEPAQPESADATALPDQPLPLPGQEAVTPPDGLELPGETAEVTPVIKVVREKEPPKSWETTLIKQAISPKTDFNYKRQVLPPQISRTQYSRQNMHLPRRVTRDDYSELLFTSVAKNDLEATRALLNAGTNLHATNNYGETPLQFARRMGATDVAALLVARGAKN
jgi:hypothetical protein